MFEKLRLPRLTESVTVEDLYTQQELDAIFASLSNYRDHAMVSVLYESACRRNELISMTWENLRFNPDSPIVTVIVKGKTGTREVYLKESVPALQRWLDIHPTKEGALWVDERIGHRPIGADALDAVIRGALERAGIKGKQKVVHMFRHTRITELVKNGIHGQSLSKLVGWTKRSNMEAVYVHLSTADVKNEIALKVFGLDGEERPARPIFENAKCPNPDCGHENPKGAVRCERCGLALSDGLILQELTQKSELEADISKLKEWVGTLETAYTDLHKKHTDLQEFVKKEVQQEIAKEQARGLAGAAIESLAILFHALATKPKKETDAFIKMLKDTESDKNLEQILQTANEFLDKEYGTTVIDGVIHVDKSKKQSGKKASKKKEVD